MMKNHSKVEKAICDLIVGYVPDSEHASKKLESLPEFLILKILYMSESKSLSSEKIEQEVSSLSPVILSNMVADNLIYQSLKNFEWNLTSEAIEKINSRLVEFEESKPKVENNSEQTEILLSRALEGFGYLTNEDSLNKGIESKIVNQLYTLKKMSFQQLNKENAGKEVLSLSNLQADNIIEHLDDYWALTDSFLKKIEVEKATILMDDAKESVSIQSEVTRYSEIIIEVLKDTPLFSSHSSDESIANSPELEILFLLYTTEGLSEQEVEEKVQNKTFFTRTISNLLIESLIVNENDKWKIQKGVAKKIDSLATNPKYKKSSITEEFPKEKKQEIIEKALKELSISYAGKEHSKYSEGAEIEILQLLLQNGPINLKGLEKRASDKPTVFLAISHLEVDGVVHKNEKHLWCLDPKFLSVYENVVDSYDFQKNELDQLTGLDYPLLQKKERELNIDTLKLRKALGDFGYLSKELTINEILKMASFKILSIILKHQSITEEEIAKYLPDAHYVPLELSNLSNEGIIEYSEVQNKWKLSRQIEILFEKTSFDEIEVLANEASLQQVNPTSPKENLTAQISEALRKKRYKIAPNLSHETLTKIPEFEVLYIIASEKAINFNEIKQEVKSNVSIPLILSNLISDQLIEEVGNEYKLSPSVLSTVKVQEKLD